MPVRTICPGCRTAYNLPGEVAGKRVRCRHCGQPFLVVEAAAATDAVVLEAEVIAAVPLRNRWRRRSCPFRSRWRRRSCRRPGQPIAFPRR